MNTEAGKEESGYGDKKHGGRVKKGIGMALSFRYPFLDLLELKQLESNYKILK
ncbi:hypothetical protein [Peribacillus simplex]|uniref:hypothetical protein n=1 Tax=Peribacillus simplex TaxID=1478 RepID=UPI000AA6FE28|nr:hypothetical protein [Peribacillus simplex]